MTSSAHAAESLLFSVILQLIVMIAAARLAYALARRLGQPGVVGEIVAGLLLGPSLLGHLAPGASAALFAGPAVAPITMIAQLGLVLLMFQNGCEFEFGQLDRGTARRATAWIAIASFAAPLLLGIGFGLTSAARLAPGSDVTSYALFCGIAMAITAVPILGRILREYRLTDAPVGVIAMAAAAANDAVGWVGLACIAAYAQSGFSPSFLLLRLAALALLLLALRFVLRPLADAMLRHWPVRDERLPGGLLAAVLCLMLALALVTSAIGIFAIFGGFAAGLLFHHHRGFVQAWRQQVGAFVLVFFLPVFFTFTGLRTDVTGLGAADLPWLGFALVLAIGGKILPVYAAARANGFPPGPAAILGSLMNTRALMELIVLNIGYDLGVLPRAPFTILVIMAVVTTLMTGPLLQLLLPRTGHAIGARVEA